MAERIAYLTGEYPRATDTFIQREVAALRSLGHEVLTCSIRKTGPEHHVGHEQQSEAAGTFNVLERAENPIHLLRCHLKAFAKSPKRYANTLFLAWKVSPPGVKNRLFHLFYFAESAVLANHLRRQDVTHLHNHIAKSSCTVAMLCSAMSGIPFSFTLHGPDIFFEPLHWRLDEKIARAKFVACISNFCRSQAMAYSDQKHWQKLHIVHCGVDPSRYRPNDKARGSELLFVGRLAAVKGVPLLLKAVRNLMPDHAELHLTLIGDGPDRLSLEAQAQSMGLANATSFVGYKSQDEVAGFLAETDVFVLPSFAEGVPVVLMEAMAAQRPVIATRIAGIPELVEDGTSGYLVAPGSVDDLTRAIDTALRHPNPAEIGAKGRRKVEAEFESRSQARRLSALFMGEKP